jgi:polyisoprenoid-binding protein YceI
VVDSDVSGTWVATSDSTLGYRVKEILGGVDTEGVGRTNDVTGSITIDGTTLTAAEFTVNMASITSDSGRRDSQYNGRIMDTATFPTATFVLTAPIELGSIPTLGSQITVTATGELTLRGNTVPVTFEITAEYSGSTIGVLGSIPIVFADYGIPNPSNAFVSTRDNGLLEFVLAFAR